MKRFTEMSAATRSAAKTLKRKTMRLDKRAIAAALTIMLVAGLQVTPTLAYYTDTAKASGSLPFLLTAESETPETPDAPATTPAETPGDTPAEGEDPTPPPTPSDDLIVEEIPDGANKVISITNTKPYSVVVRVCVYATNDGVKITPKTQEGNSEEAMWRADAPVDDGVQNGQAWLWYTGTLAPNGFAGDTTTQLTLEMDASGVTAGTPFDVYVVAEYGKAEYFTDVTKQPMPAVKLASDADGDGEGDTVMLSDLDLVGLQQVPAIIQRQDKALRGVHLALETISDDYTPQAPYTFGSDSDAHPEHEQIAEIMHQFPQELAGDMKSYYFHYLCKSNVSSTGSTEDFDAFL